MPWPVMGDVSLYSEGNYTQAYKWVKLNLFTSLTPVCTSFCHFIWTAFKFETELLMYPKPDSNTVKQSEETAQLAQKLFVGHMTQGQPQHRILSLSDAEAAHGAFPFQIGASEDMASLASPQITRERNSNLNGLLPQSTGTTSRPRRALEEEDDGEGSTEHHAKFRVVAPDSSSGKEIARLHGYLVELERQLSETLHAKNDRDRYITQLTDELTLKSALLERAEADAAEAKKRAALEQRELRAELGELLQSRDQSLEQAQSALQKATFRAAEANERSQRELTEVHAKLETRESELAAIRLRLSDADGLAKSKAEGGLVNMDVDRVMWRLMERVRVVEVEVASLRGNEKIIESMECRNEG